jgi:hypothetical protein
MATRIKTWQIINGELKETEESLVGKINRGRHLFS